MAISLLFDNTNLVNADIYQYPDNQYSDQSSMHSFIYHNYTV